jgi:hypothetical protein
VGKEEAGDNAFMDDVHSSRVVHVGPVSVGSALARVEEEFSQLVHVRFVFRGTVNKTIEFCPSCLLCGFEPPLNLKDEIKQQGSLLKRLNPVKNA